MAILMYHIFKGQKDILKFQVGNGEEFIETGFLKENEVEGSPSFQLREEDGGTRIIVPILESDHILGLGEKAFPVERKRTTGKMWNYDSYNYSLGYDPLYVSIPFFMKTGINETIGYFINYTGEINFDFGVTDYTNIIIDVKSENFSFYVLNGETPEVVLQKYTDLTGKPFHIPEWALEHQISKYSYYPEERVEEVVENYQKAFGPHAVGSVYLDIDYMDEYNIFTEDKNKFPGMKEMIERLHGKNVRVIPIIDPGLKADQKSEIFRKGLGSYIETSRGEIYTGDVWPGKCVFPDFFKKEGGDFWFDEMSKFLSKGYDGVWLDMNEPSVHNVESRTVETDAVHEVNGKMVKHSEVHNAYALKEAEYTYKAMKPGKSYILSRSGFAGIQKYAAIWSGDGLSTFENMGLQIPILTSLSISGVPYVGCDLGGFSGYSSPELILRFYQMALFFPVYRNHKVKMGNDQELYVFDSYYRKRFSDLLNIRHNFVPYLYWKCVESEKFGTPVIRPLAFNFPKEDGIFTIDDEYMVGDELLLAPIVVQSQENRELYLPDGMWYDYESSDIYMGHRRIRSTGDLPLYQKKNSVIIVGQKIYYFGNVEREVYFGNKWHRFKSVNGTVEIDGKEDSEKIAINIEMKKPLLKDLIS